MKILPKFRRWGILIAVAFLFSNFVVSTNAFDGGGFFSSILKAIQQDSDYKLTTIKVVETEGGKEVISKVPYSPNRYGKLEDKVSLTALGGIVSLSFQQGTTLTVEGAAYNATIMPPYMINFEVIPPSGLKAVGDVYEVGPSGVEIQIDKTAILQLPLPSDADPNDNWAVYYWDKQKSQWLIVEDGGTLKQFSNQEAALLDEYGKWWIDQGGSFVIEVEINHFTKFVVMRDRKALDDIESLDKVERGLVSLDTDKIPDQLFDINLEIDDNLISDIGNLTVRVIFVSFGKVPTPVDLDFSILDSKGEVIHSVKDYIVVETEAVLQKKFFNLNLSLGKYTLILNTLYSHDVADEFRQNFEIVAPEFNNLDKLFFLGFGILIGGGGVLFIFKTRKKISTKLNEKNDG